MKTCSSCKELKSNSEFSKNSFRKDGLHNQCKICKNYSQKNWRKKKLERTPQYNSNYQKEWRACHPDYQKEWHACRPDYLRRYMKQWRKDNPNKRDDYNKHWRKNNMDRILTMRQNRRALKLNAKGSHSASDIENLIDLQQCKCVYCQIELMPEGVRKYHIDHIMPLFLGGSNSADNLQLLCPTCNLSKGSKHPDVYEKTIGYIRLR